MPDSALPPPHLPTHPDPDPSYVWLIHAVGQADLALRGRRDDSRAGTRTAALAQAVDAGDEDLLWSLLWEGRYDDGPHSVPTPSPHLAKSLPLPKLLRGLATPDASVDRVSVLLVAAASSGPRDTGLRVSDLRDTLCAALTALTRRIHRELCGAIELVDVRCAVPPDLGERSVLADLLRLQRSEFPGGPSRVMIGWGSGATSVPLSAASAAVRLGLPWHLLDYTNREPGSAPGRADVVNPLEAVDPTRNSVITHLTRLRLFHELARLAASGPDGAPEVPLTPDQAAAVKAMVDLIDRGYRAENAEALRQVAREALVRRDGTAGFALRRYVIESYREECRRLAVPSAQSGRADTPQLGCLQKQARDALRSDPHHEPNRWITSPEVDAVKDFGNAAHEFRLSLVEEADQIARWMSEGDGPCDAEARITERLGIRPATGPAARLLAVWAVGKEREGVDSRPSVATHLLHTGPGAEIERYLGSARFPLRALLLATTESECQAERQLQELALREPPAPANTLMRVPAPAPSRSVEAMVVSVGPDIFDRTMVRSHLRAHLERSLTDETDDVGGLLLVPTGPKPVVLSALLEMFRISSERAIPLFVRDIATTGDSQSGLHLWPASVGHDRPLFTVALGAFDRLELDAAARLLAATSHAEDLTERCQSLADEFTGRLDDQSPSAGMTALVPMGSTPGRGRLAQRLGLVAQCASSLSAATDPHNALMTRYLVLAATLIESWRGLRPQDGLLGRRRDKWCLLEQVLRDLHDVNRPHAAVLLTLRTARNKVPLTHASAPDAEAAVANALTGLKVTGDRAPTALPWPQSPSALSLLQAAPAAAAPWDLRLPDDPSLLDRYLDLRRNIERARDRARVPGK